MKLFQNASSLPARLLCAAAVVVILVGCGGAGSAQVPTPDQQATLNAVKQEVASTIIAGMTASAPTITNTPAATATQPPTATLAPTNTLPPPTNTPIPPTATFRPATWTPTYTPTQAAFQCSVLEQSPANGAKLAKNTDFDGRWKIKNTGTKKWLAADSDFRFVSGTKFQTKIDLADLTADIEPGKEYTVTIDMRTPDNQGSFNTAWALYANGEAMCTMYLNINVTE